MAVIECGLVHKRLMKDDEFSALAKDVLANQKIKVKKKPGFKINRAFFVIYIKMCNTQAIK